jgi:hypothetical protein
MPDVVEAALDVAFDRPPVREHIRLVPAPSAPGEHQRFEVRDGPMHGLRRTKAVRGRIEIRLEDGLQDVLHCSLNDPVFHGGDPERAVLPEFAWLRDENPSNGARSVPSCAKLLAELLQEGLDTRAKHVCHRDPVYAAGASAAVAVDAREGDSEVAGVCDESRQLLEHVGRVVTTSRVQLALHVQEPETIVPGCHIHGLPLRLHRCTHLLPSFAMYAAFPRLDYYDGSVPRPRHHRAWRLAGVARSGARIAVPTFLEENPWCFRWTALPLAALVDAESGCGGDVPSASSDTPDHTNDVVQIALPYPHFAVSTPYRGFRHCLQPARH